MDVKDTMKVKDRSEFSDVLCQKINDYIQNSILGNVTIKSVYQLFVVNVIVQTVIIVIL